MGRLTARVVYEEVEYNEPWEDIMEEWLAVDRDPSPILIDRELMFRIMQDMGM
jgi:hypothetical protein